MNKKEAVSIEEEFVLANEPLPPMTNNLRLYTTIFTRMRQLLPKHRITQVRNLALIMTGLALARSVHLDRISNQLPLPGKIPSLSNRLRRFLSNTRLSIITSYAPVAKALLARFNAADLMLLLDTTQLGRHHRLLTVALAYRGRAFPLWFSVHRGKKGHVKVREAIRLLTMIRPWLPHDRVCVLGDSAFGEVELIQQLSLWKWRYVLRLKGHYSLCCQETGWVRLIDLGLKPGQHRWLGAVTLTKKHRFVGASVGMLWSEGEDEPWYLVTSQQQWQPTLRCYGKRMWIEELYGDLKGHGFDLEASRLGTVVRLERLVLAVSLVYVWLLAFGSWVVKRGLRHYVDRRDRRDKSYFRIGWDWLDRQLRLDYPIRVFFQPYLSK